MMRLFELIQQPITEQAQPIALIRDGITIEQVNTVANFVKQNCSKWLAETNDGQFTFYRGLKENMALYLAFTQPVRTDRQPRDSIPIGHDTYNTMIDAVGGIANRSNSIFAVSNYMQARAYGRPGGQASVIFPIGDYHYTWSNKWDDWNIESVEQMEALISGYMHHVPDVHADAEYAYEERIDDLQHQAQNAHNEADRELIEKEIQELETYGGKLDFIEEYIEDSGGDSTLFELYTDPDNYKKDVLSKILMVDQGLWEAANAHHEVMIHCDNVLYIDNQFYELVWAVLRGKNPDFSLFGKVPGEAP